jgi:hypothetical protein
VDVDYAHGALPPAVVFDHEQGSDLIFFEQPQGIIDESIGTNGLWI